MWARPLVQQYRHDATGPQIAGIAVSDRAKPQGLAETSGTLTDLLKTRSIQNRDQLACFHLQGGETPTAHLTYGAMFDAARGVAATLAARLPVGARVILVFPNEPDFVPVFLGCILAGMVAVPLPPPSNIRGMERIHELAQVAGAELAILSSGLRRGFDRLHSQIAPNRDGPDWVYFDELKFHAADDWVDPGSQPDTLAVLQFTSGSTGTSKGVMVRHSNILQNARLFRSEIAPQDVIRLVTWLPFFHDWGLFGCFLYPMIDGGVSIYFDPSDFLQRPRCWFEAISEHRATVCCAPDFAFNLASQAMERPGGIPVDLSSLVMAKFGAEPVRQATLERFIRVCAPVGFDPKALCPSYGLAESTLIVTGGGQNLPVRTAHLDRMGLENQRVAPVSADAPGARDVVACGKPLLDQKVRIVDPSSRCLCPDDGVGEIWMQGGSVTAGYWRLPDETRTVFQAVIQDDPASGHWLRTGDLGFLDAGELFICGRLKDIIIKAGANYFAEDLERSFDKCHPDLRPGCGAAFGIDVEGAERLVAVQEINYGPRTDLGQLIGAIQREISRDHAVMADAIAILPPGTLEKTPSGKIRRQLTRSQFLADTLNPIKLWQSW